MSNSQQTMVSNSQQNKVTISLQTNRSNSQQTMVCDSKHTMVSNSQQNKVSKSQQNKVCNRQQFKVCNSHSSQLSTLQYYQQHQQAFILPQPIEVNGSTPLGHIGATQFPSPGDTSPELTSKFLPTLPILRFCQYRRCY